MTVHSIRWCYAGLMLAGLLVTPALAQQFTGRSEVGDSLPQRAASANFESVQMAGESLAGPDSQSGTYTGASGPDPRDFASPVQTGHLFADGFEG